MLASEPECGISRSFRYGAQPLRARRDRDFARCLYIGRGSASEAECQLILARDLGALAPEIHEVLDVQVNEIIGS